MKNHSHLKQKNDISFRLITLAISKRYQMKMTFFGFSFSLTELLGLVYTLVHEIERR